MNGGQAVPDVGVLMGGSGSLEDTSSLDDSGLNSSDSLEESVGTAASGMGGKGGQDIRDAPETRHFRCRVTCAGGLTSCIIGA